MYDVSALLTPQFVMCGIQGHSRKRVLQTAAQNMADGEINADKLFDGLMERERLGSTGLGDGAAIPHCRMPCSTIRGMLLTLTDEVDFEAPDNSKVNLIFVLVVPEDEARLHLDALASLSSIFSDPDKRAALQRCGSADDVIATLRSYVQADQQTGT